MCRRLARRPTAVTNAAAIIAVGFCLALAPVPTGAGITAAQAQEAEDDFDFVTQKLALQVSGDDAATMRSALDIAANVSRFYTDQAEEVDIRIVVFGEGMGMLRPDQTAVMDRLRAFDQSMPNVSFVACGNTLDSLERAEGKRPELVPFAEVVQAGVAELMRLDQAGYTIVKP